MVLSSVMSKIKIQTKVTYIRKNQK